MTLAFGICRQEHFREFAEGIVPQVNDAIALARELKMPIYYSQHGQHASLCLCATCWSQLLRKPTSSRCGPDAMAFPMHAGHPDPATDHNRNVIVCEDPCATSSL